MRNRTLTTKSLAPLVWCLLWLCGYIGTAAAQRIAISFTYDPVSQPFLLVPVSINNSRPAWCLLDTGNYWPLAVTEKFAKKIGLPLDRRVVQKGSNNAEVTLVPVQSITIGKDTGNSVLKLPDKQVVLVTSHILEDASTAYGIEIVGIVGVAALESLGKSVLIDFGTNTLIIGAPKPNTDDASRVGIVALKKKWWQYGVPLQMGTGKTVELLLDTGCYSVLLKAGIEGLPVKARHEGTTRLAQSVVTEALLLSEVRAGTLREEDVPAGISVSLDASLPWDGLLGLSFLNRFRVWLDFANHQIVLERLPDSDRRRALPGADEATLAQQIDGYVVRGIAADGPLYKAGVREGDKVIEVDGVRLSKLTPLVAEAVLTGLGGTEAKLVIERGGEKKTVSYTRRSLFDMHGVSTTASAAPNHPTKTPGAMIMLTEKGFIIVQVAPGSPAEKAGLKVGDEVVEFNGLRFMSLTAEQILKLGETLRSLTRPGANKMVIRRDGRTMEITIEL